MSASGQKTMKTIEDALRSYIASLPEGRLRAATSHALLSGGKRIRPRLMLAVLEAKGLDPDPYVDVAIALELLHTYSLIHDDLPAMDDDTMRRGKPTVHIVFDEATAILAGDALLTDSFNVIASSGILTFEQKARMTEILSAKTGSRGMVLGQMDDIESEQKDITGEALDRMVALKTANLIEASLMMGAAIAAPDEIGQFELIGHSIGMIFQIQDDILEHTTSAEQLGKSKSDIRRAKPTYVSLFGLEKSQTVLSGHRTVLEDLMTSLDLHDTGLDHLINEILNRKN